MDAQTLHCPNCGAATSSDSIKCDHCGASLATVACPSCFGLIFRGAKFCAHCGAPVSRREDDAAQREKMCPHCDIALQKVTLGSVEVQECRKCEGLWVDVATFESICRDREQQAAVLGGASPFPSPLELTLAPVRYLRCPDCRTLMNRVNFAKRSGVIVDTCRGHGTWFDRDELRHIVEFIRSGGVEQVRTAELQELEHAKRRSPTTGIGSAPVDLSGSRFGSAGDSDVLDLLMMVGGAVARLFVK